MSEEVIIEGTGEVVPAGSMALTTARRSDYGLIRAESPKELMGRATEAANVLASMIRAQKLSVRIQNRDFVKVEGWATLAAMMGATPHEVENTEDTKRPGVYVAVVELRRISDGAVVGRGSGECGSPDEFDRNGKPLWSERPAYARRSMAATRATGKACRLAYSWIMGLAGYEVTPAEEVPPGGFPDDRHAPEPRQPMTPAQANAAVDRGEGLPTEITFGKNKGRRIADLEMNQLAWYIKAAEENINNPAKAKFMDREIVALRAYRREHAGRLDMDGLQREWEAHERERGIAHGIATEEYARMIVLREGAPGVSDGDAEDEDRRGVQAEDTDGIPF